ncbi:CBS domain-containing protein [Streptomyces iconiensis]|uniref:CBS domain-containing protein n=1 Tax=Streptomyces iconiensis TaxID=1384038 RepID=A0ABT7A2B3_9ACTN|nr:CBS domain-containing protein [Streptomyces iconiensis]MDJ1135483.1 CBS domain-containing protein [Streptomyces iconiensis]
MTCDVVQAGRTTPLQDVVRLLGTAERISVLPVVDEDNKALGVASGTDLVVRRGT